MKKGTPRHPKMYALAEALKIPLPMAVGIMEMLWHFVGANTPRGDIGSAPDIEIAAAVGWPKKPAPLIEALCAEKSRWLDRDHTHRLIVHDWPEHAEYEVCRKLVSSGKDFLEVYGISAQLRAKSAPMRADSEQMRASREAKALAKALGVVVPEKKTLEVSLPAGYAFDEQYEQFRSECKSWGMNVVDPEDFIEAWWAWAKLDGLQRAEAITGLVARREAGADPQFAKSPKNYIYGREWKRSIRGPVQAQRPNRSRLSGV